MGKSLGFLVLVIVAELNMRYNRNKSSHRKEMNKTIMKAVIYARYSSDNQREESIEGQIRECTAFAEKNDITVLKHCIDRAYSARTDHRPAFQEMIKDSDKHLFDMVIVLKLDRFSRGPLRQRPL